MKSLNSRNEVENLKRKKFNNTTKCFMIAAGIIILLFVIFLFLSLTDNVQNELKNGATLSSSSAIKRAKFRSMFGEVKFESFESEEVTTSTTKITTYTTTPSTTHINDDVNEHKVTLLCKLPENENIAITTEITDQLLPFKIHSESVNSVIITFSSILFADLLIFKTQSMENNILLPISDTSLRIQALNKDEAYVFCVMPTGAVLTSPFNCRSHQIGLKKNYPMKTSWLSISDLPIFILITVLSITLCFFIGLIGVYLMLRCHPTLIGKNKRLAKVESNSKSKNKDAHDALRKYNSLHRADRLTSNSYIQYFNNAEMPPLTETSAGDSTVLRSRHYNIYTISPTGSLDCLETIFEDQTDHDYETLKRLP